MVSAKSTFTPYAAFVYFAPVGRSDRAPGASGTAHGCPALQEHPAAPRRALPFATPGAEQSLNNRHCIRQSLADHPRSAGKKATHGGWRQSATAFCRDKFPRPLSGLPGEAPVLGATPSCVRRAAFPGSAGWRWQAGAALNLLWEKSGCQAQGDAVLPEPEPGLCFTGDVVVFPTGDRGPEGDANLVPKPMWPKTGWWS